MKRLILLFTFFAFFGLVKGQQSDNIELVVDDIQINVRNVSLSAKGDTAVIELFLISYQKNPREFKLNTFASGIVDSQGATYLYESMRMGKILISLEDRQNYMHYLLEQDVPVSLKIMTPNWKKNWGKPKQLKLTFEESTEEGKFLETIIDL